MMGEQLLSFLSTTATISAIGLLDHHLLKHQAVRSHRHRILSIFPVIAASVAGKADSMDFHFRASTIHSAKHLSAVQAARLHYDNSSVLDLDTDDPGSLFSCPICDFGVELHVLCSHLQEEHCFDLKNAVCPVCAANLGKDPVGHLTIQHPSLLKRRWKSAKASIWYGNSAMLGKKLATDSWGNKHESAPDPLLSPFICSVSVPNPNSTHREELFINNILIASDANCTGTNTHVGNEQDHQERREKAIFVQELVASAIS